MWSNAIMNCCCCYYLSIISPLQGCGRWVCQNEMAQKPLMVSIKRCHSPVSWCLHSVLGVGHLLERHGAELTHEMSPSSSYLKGGYKEFSSLTAMSLTLECLLAPKQSCIPEYNVSLWQQLTFVNHEAVCHASHFKGKGSFHPNQINKSILHVMREYGQGQIYIETRETTDNFTF